MALSLGALSVTIGADTTQLQEGVARSRRELRALGRSMRRGINQAGQYGAAIAGVGAALGTYLVRNSLNAQRNLRNLREETAVNLRTLQGLQEVAVQYGIEQQEVNDVVRDFSERLGEARTAGGEMKEGFEILEDASGVTIDITKDVNTVLNQYIKAMSNVEDAQTRAAISAMIMSDAGRQMAPVFSKGAKAIQNAADEARQMGSALSAVDMRMVAQARIALSRLERVAEAVGNRLTVALAPIITTIASRFEDAAKDAGGFRDTILSVMEQTNKALVVGKSAVVAFRVAWKGVLVVGNAVVAGWADILAQLMKYMRQGSNVIIEQVNKIIAATQRLPFMDGLTKLPRAAKSSLEEGLAGTAEQARADIQRLGEEMHNLITNADTLEDVEARWDSIRESVRAAAEEAANSAAVAQPAPKVAQDKEGRFMTEGQRKKELKRFRETLMTRRQIEQQHHMTRMEKLRAWREQELIMEQEFRALARKEEQRHQQKLTKITQSHAKTRQEFVQSSFIRQADTAAGQLQRMTSSVANENKKMFQLNKVAGIANAVINTYQGITNALSAYPPPLSFVMAAAQAAAGFAQVSAIKSKSFSGGGGSGGGVRGAAAGSTAQGGGGAQGQQGGGESQKTVNATFAVEGDAISKRQFRGMMEGLNETLDDGARLGAVRVE